MLFAVDIDGTVSGYSPLTFINYVNSQLRLGISSARLTEIATIEALERSPEFTAWQASSPAHQEYYAQVRSNAQYDLDLQRAAIPVNHAVDAINALSEFGKVIYVTLRKPSSEEVTRQWLTHNGFPSPSSAFCCQHFHYKYIEAYKHLSDNEHLVMIDDQCRMLLRGYYRLTQMETKMASSLRKRMAFVSFGPRPVDPIPEKLEFFPIRRIPSWRSEQFRTLYEEVSHELADKRCKNALWR